MPRPAPDGGHNEQVTQLPVRHGEVLPIGGSLYRVLEIQRPADGRGSVVIDAQALASLGVVKLHANALAITSGGHGSLSDMRIEVQRIASLGEAIAHVEVMPAAYARDDLKPAQISAQQLKAGQNIMIGGKQHRVLAVVAPGAETRGWIEVAIAAN